MYLTVDRRNDQGKGLCNEVVVKRRSLLYNRSKGAKTKNKRARKRSKKQGKGAKSKAVRKAKGNQEKR